MLFRSRNNATLYGVTNRTLSKAHEFAKQYQIPHVFATYEEMIEDKNIDMIYITTPHNTHIPYIMNALEHGKHVLCEKSITLNSKELEKAVALSKEKGRILAEAITLYHMPIYNQLDEIVNDGKQGNVIIITVTFGRYKTSE